jgi:Zn-dependent protease
VPPLRAITIARVATIEIACNWRWLPVLGLVTVLLAHSVLPARFPAWDPSTTWLTSLALVLGGEAALLLHELSHALVARRRGHRVMRIVFHGFVAETVLECQPEAEVLVALVGPATNVAIAIGAQTARAVLHSSGPLDVCLLLLLLGNAAMAVISLQPFGASDGARALSALRSSSYQ